MIVERSEHNQLTQYRKGEYIPSRLHAQTVINKIARLIYRGGAYEKQLEVG